MPAVMKMTKKVIVFLDIDRKEIFEGSNLKVKFNPDPSNSIRTILSITDGDEKLGAFSAFAGWRYQDTPKTGDKKRSQLWFPKAQVNVIQEYTKDMEKALLEVLMETKRIIHSIQTPEKKILDLRHSDGWRLKKIVTRETIYISLLEDVNRISVSSLTSTEMIVAMKERLDAIPLPRVEVDSFKALVAWSKDHNMPEEAMDQAETCCDKCPNVCGNRKSRDWCEQAASHAIINWAESQGYNIVQVKAYVQSS